MTDPGPAPTHGRNRITARALKRVVSAITADALGVSAGQVSVRLGDAEGLLKVTASAPISVHDLTAPAPSTSTDTGTDGSIVARGAAAQETIRDRVLQLTGSAVGPVTLRLNDAHIQAKGRVQ